jgi:hypothetical protein
MPASAAICTWLLLVVAMEAANGRARKVVTVQMVRIAKKRIERLCLVVMLEEVYLMPI